MFGKSATLICDYLLSSKTFNPEYCVSLFQHSLKKKVNSVLKSIEPKEINTGVIAYWGRLGIDGRNNGNMIGNYIPWLVKNKECISTF